RCLRAPPEPWRHDLTTTSSFTELWPWLLILALLLWPFDIALRRVSIGRRGVAGARAWVGRAGRGGGSGPTPGRGSAGRGAGAAPRPREPRRRPGCSQPETGRPGRRRERPSCEH